MTELDEILEDAHEVFCYDKAARPQDGAHAYLGRNRLMRGYDDTAMECVVRDLVTRAYEAGRNDDESPALTEAKRIFAAIANASNDGLATLES